MAEVIGEFFALWLRLVGFCGSVVRNFSVWIRNFCALLVATVVRVPEDGCRMTVVPLLVRGLA